MNTGNPIPPNNDTAGHRVEFFRLPAPGKRDPHSPATTPQATISPMTTMIRVFRHGRLTLPPALCRKLGLAKLRAPMVSVEECEGGLFLRPAPTIPASHRVELNRRLAALAKNPDQGRPWTKVRETLRRRR